MSYLVLQIILYLVAAALAGLGFGWFLGRRGLDEAVAEQQAQKAEAIAGWKSRHQEALDLGDVARKRISALEADIDSLRAELQAKSEEVIRLKGQVG